MDELLPFRVQSLNINTKYLRDMLKNLNQRDIKVSQQEQNTAKGCITYLLTFHRLFTLGVQNF